MLNRSISRADAAPRPTASARRRMRPANRRRCSAVSRFESSTPAMARTSGGMMTAQATTGPAKGPRPTSSTPAIMGPTVARSSRSTCSHRRALRLPDFTGTPVGRLLPCRRRGLSHGGHRLGRRRLANWARDRDADAALLLADARCLAREVAEVIQLCPPNTPTTHDVNFGDHRAVNREDAFDADAVRDLANGERLADPATAACDTDPLERLDALLVALLDAYGNAESVARAERRKLLAEPLFLSL